MDLQLFFSWQMETDAQGFYNKSFLNACIKEACDNVSGTGQLRRDKIHFHEGMRASTGTPNVANEMFKQIDSCHIFVADITTAQRLSKLFEPFRNKHGVFFRYSPNCNVFGEYNRALGKKPNFEYQIILLANRANKSVLDDRDVIPFDTRGRRDPILFELKNNSDSAIQKAKVELMPQLEKAIRDSAIAAKKNFDEEYKPFVSWAKHLNDGRFKGFRVDKDVVAKYKARILKDSRTLCVIGPDDYRKTHLVHKAFEDSDYADQYFYAYLDHKTNEKHFLKLDEILSKVHECILVIDNCETSDITTILNYQKKYSSSNRIICLYSNQVSLAKLSLTASFDDIFDITDDLIDHREHMFIKADIRSKEVQEYITQFCDNNEDLIGFVLNGINRGTDSTENLAKQITDILTDSQPGTFGRTIWQSIALFDRIGWKENRAKELEYIITNKSITVTPETDNYIINATSALIRKALDMGWLKKKGNSITISLASLANQLTYEWFASVDIERFNRVLKAINDSPVKRALTVEFHDRFGYMASNAETHTLVTELLKPSGSFNASILDSDDGLLVLEAFAAANPEAVTEFLTRIINTKTTDQLSAMLFNSSRLVWIIEKLCFRSNLFFPNALLMLRLATAENDVINQEASRNFYKLFPVFLPATSANLDIRYDFLQKHYQIPEYKQYILKALGYALQLRGNLLLTGAEKLGDQESEPYMPATKKEAADYLIRCLDLIEREIVSDGQYKSECIEILENHLISFCSNGYAFVMLPYIERTAAQMNNDWPSVQEDLVRYKDTVWNLLSPESQTIYQDLITDLTKTDFVSRFARIDKEMIYAHPKMDFAKRVRTKEEAYKKLAHEAYTQNLLTDENLEKLILARVSSYPFGSSLAKLMTPDEQVAFIHRYLTICNLHENASNNILCDFVTALDDTVFNLILDDLVGSRISNTIFICFGNRGILPSSEKFQVLHRVVAEQRAPVDDYLYYFYRINFMEMDTDVVLALLSEIQSHPNSFNTVMHVCTMLSTNNQLANNQQLSNFIETTLIEYMDSHSDILSSREACEIGQQLLLSSTRTQLALRFNKAILDYASQQDVLFYSSYEIEQIYGILMKLYFDDIWPSLSEMLLSDGEHNMSYYHMKSLLGLTLSGDKRPILLEGNHWDTILEWCKQYPDIAPARIAGLIPVMDKNNQFSPEAKQLIDLYADKPYVLNEIGCSLDSFSSVGSVIPYYELRKTIYQSMLTHPNLQVQQWAQQQINGIDQMIEMESTREEEMFG